MPPIKKEIIPTDPIKMIEHWRKTFGLKVEKSYMRLEQVSKSELALGLKLMQEELSEAVSAVITNDDTEFKDSVADMLFILVQIANTSGIDLQDIVGKVYVSNMSKLCPTEQSAADSIEKYSKQGIEAYYQQLDNGTFIIKRKKDDKVLKGVLYQCPKDI